MKSKTKLRVLNVRSNNLYYPYNIKNLTAINPSIKLVHTGRREIEEKFSNVEPDTWLKRPYHLMIWEKEKHMIWEMSSSPKEPSILVKSSEDEPTKRCMLPSIKIMCHFVIIQWFHIPELKKKWSQWDYGFL